MTSNREWDRYENQDGTAEVVKIDQGGVPVWSTTRDSAGQTANWEQLRLF